MKEAGRVLTIAAAAVLTLLAAGCNLNDGDASDWIVGYWLGSYSSAPYTNVVQFAAGGQFRGYDDYAATGLEFVSIWSLDGDVLTLDGDPLPITKLNDDHFLIMSTHLYRKGSEPGGWIFSSTPTVLSAGVWQQDSLALSMMKLYAFTAAAGGTYWVAWDDEYEGSGATTGDIEVSAYRADEATEIFAEQDSGYSDPLPVSLSAGETMYLVADAIWSGGSYRIMVQ